jgi:hypothetical protein
MLPHNPEQPLSFNFKLTHYQRLRFVDTGQQALLVSIVPVISLAPP